MQGLLRAEGVTMSKREIAMAQNGDLAMNVTPERAGQLLRAGLINESQFGALANGGSARFSFADNDLLVSSSAGFQQSARSDSSTRFEAGKQAGPDTIEHFLGGGEEGRAAMENWLRGGFEMDRKGEWRLKPQVADTLQRDVQAIMAQTGWQRSLSRSAEKQTTMGTSWGANLGGGATVGPSEAEGSGRGGTSGKGSRGSRGHAGIQVGIDSRDTGSTNSRATSTMDIANYDVRTAIAAAEKSAARSNDPAATFSQELGKQIMGRDGLRNRYLENSDSGRGTWDYAAPVTSMEQSAILKGGRFTTDHDQSGGDGDPAYKTRKD